MATATLTSKGQITIPRQIRDQLEWRSGDRLDFIVDAAGRVVVERAPRDIRALRGMLRRPGKPVSTEAMDDAIAAHLSDSYGGDQGG